VSLHERQVFIAGDFFMSTLLLIWWRRQAKPARLVSKPAHFDRWHPERLFEYRSPHSRENLPLRFFQSEELFGFPAILPTHFVRLAHFAGAEFLFESFPHRSPIDSLADLRLQSLAP
jgi:hypothetical protein